MPINDVDVGEDIGQDEKSAFSRFVYSIATNFIQIGNIWKKSLLNNQYYLFSNSRSLERPGLNIESLEYYI